MEYLVRTGCNRLRDVGTGCWSGCNRLRDVGTGCWTGCNRLQDVGTGCRNRVQHGFVIVGVWGSRGRVGTVGSHPGIVDSHPGTVGEVGHSQSDNHEIDVASMGHSMGKDDTVHSNHSTLQESRASHMLQSLAWAHGTNAQPRTAPRLGTLPHKLPTGQAT